MAQGPWNYMVVGNKSFFDADPAVRALMEQVSWPAKTWSAWEKEINEGANTDEAVRRMADSWIAKNGETFEKWIKAALAAT
jgi:glycine betaine/proline transport system substrate-binding protein